MYTRQELLLLCLGRRHCAPKRCVRVVPAARASALCARDPVCSQRLLSACDYQVGGACRREEFDTKRVQVL